MALCSQSDVEMRLQIDFTSASDPVCAALIAAAQGHIEREVGYPLESVGSLVESFDGDRLRSTVWLKRRPLTAVASVVEDGTTLTVTTDYLFYSEGRIVRVSSGYATGWRTSKLQGIVVTYTAGYTFGAAGTVPQDLVDLCANVAARAFQEGAAFAALPDGSAGGSVRSISLEGSDSVEFAESAGGGLATASVTRPVQLTQEEIELCHAYRIPAIA